MADIDITIGATRDASVERAFAQIKTGAKGASSEVNAEMRKALVPLTNPKAREAVRALSAELKEQLRQREAGERRIMSAATAAAKRREREERQAAREMMRAYREASNQRRKDEADLTRERIRAERKVAQEATRAAREAARIRRQFLSQEAAAERKALRERESIARRTSHRATRFALPSTSLGTYAARYGGAAARGLGLQSDLASNLSSSLEAETAAVNIVNTATDSGSTTPGDVLGTARATSRATGRDTREVLAALESYKKRTGSLKEATGLLDELGKVGVAVGANLEQLFGTAGELANQLNVPGLDKQKAVVELVKTFAGQGNIGAVELEDLSKYGARIASTAGLYSGNVVENIKVLGALTQAARSEGGADSAAMAATSVARLATTFKTGARVKAFRKYGINVSEEGQLASPVDVIKAAAVASKDDPQKLNEMFMNIMGARAAEGLVNKFRTARTAALGKNLGETKATDAGLDAIDDYIEKNVKAQLSDADIAKANSRVRETGAFAVNELNVQWQEAADELRMKLIPALRDATPALVELAKKLGSVATWVVDNPKTAIAAGIGLSIARAGIESVLRAGIERAMMGAMASSAATGGAGLAAAAAGRFGKSVAGVGAGLVGFNTVDTILQGVDSNYGGAASGLAQIYEYISGGGSTVGNISSPFAGSEKLEASAAEQAKNLQTMNRKLDGTLKVQIVGSGGIPQLSSNVPATSAGEGR